MFLGDRGYSPRRSFGTFYPFESEGDRERVCRFKLVQTNRTESDKFILGGGCTQANDLKDLNQMVQKSHSRDRYVKVTPLFSSVC